MHQTDALWNRAYMAPGPVLQGFSFFPRGGSSHVVRYLAAALRQAGWSPRIVAGSVGAPGDLSHAETFFAGLPVSAADFTPALDAWRRGEDPLAQPVPLHASYEDKPGAPDRILAGVSPELATQQVDSWCRLLAGLRPFAPLVLHLHHLTPLHDAAVHVWPDVPVVTHLHGTELHMLEQIEQYSGAVPPASWTYAAYWTERLRATAQRSDTHPRRLHGRRRPRGSHPGSTRGSGDCGTQRGRHGTLPAAGTYGERATGAAATLARR